MVYIFHQNDAFISEKKNIPRTIAEIDTTLKASVKKAVSATFISQPTRTVNTVLKCDKNWSSLHDKLCVVQDVFDEAALA